jgi:hypothetical protein
MGGPKQDDGPTPRRAEWRVFSSEVGAADYAGDDRRDGVGQIAERTRDAVRRKQHNGRPTSTADRPPHGWRAEWEGPRNEESGKPLNFWRVP